MITDQIVEDTRIHDWATAVMTAMQALSGLENRTSLGFFLFFMLPHTDRYLPK